LSNTCDRLFCIEALEEALEEHGCPEIFNTDQGSTFTAPDFIKVLVDHNVKISMDGKGRALDNIYIERFWRTLKQDEVYLHAYTGMRDAEEKIRNYINVYNTRRPHSSINGQYPLEYYIKELRAA
jgi:putative transposase